MRFSANFLTDFFTETETRSLSFHSEEFCVAHLDMGRYLSDTYAPGLELLSLALNWSLKAQHTPGATTYCDQVLPAEVVFPVTSDLLVFVPWLTLLRPPRPAHVRERRRRPDPPRHGRRGGRDGGGGYRGGLLLHTQLHEFAHRLRSLHLWLGMPNLHLMENTARNRWLDTVSPRPFYWMLNIVQGESSPPEPALG